MNKEPPVKCEECSSTEGVLSVHALTAYHWDGPEDSPDNPNRSRMYCPACAKEYTEYWTAMWDEYNGMRG